MPTKTGFITGTGFYTLPGISEAHSQEIETPFGRVPVETGTFTVQVPFFAPPPSNTTVCVESGTWAPPAPPEVKLQFAVLFHFPAAHATQ